MHQQMLKTDYSLFRLDRLRMHVLLRLDTKFEIDMYKADGIFHTIVDRWTTVTHA